ncbi:hypothetical protein CWI42_100180 [Ordospora colligata]|uniref:Uncharacterized protein n=1 Tax=Ordospora colligata OC4 TaxID=1354746 RepID=A0A0B2UIG3_9MICR|nr:uncharacterized protein M896_100180 [Ordospora colligata OC4]KHN69034.1 hypothetical protein M896_100180 [Ordospora colligata OC4]TBU14380.1 hypothetical protein CWI41_100190 [Ordospora colligata]TBU17996.1 hypothetical protein CWI42_100180 [Ordospora colligata]
MEIPTECQTKSKSILELILTILRIVCISCIWGMILVVCILIILITIIQSNQYSNIFPNQLSIANLHSIVPCYCKDKKTFEYSYYYLNSNPQVQSYTLDHFTMIHGLGSDICMFGEDNLKEKGILIMFFPGNAFSAIETLLSLRKMYYQRYNEDVCVATMIYKGLGMNLKPSEANLKKDIDQFNRHVNDLNQDTTFMIRGFSIGCAPAIYLASKIKKPDNTDHKLIIQNPFRSMSTIVREILPKTIGSFIALFIDKWDNEAELLNVDPNIKVYLFISNQDNLIDPKTNQLVLSKSLGNTQKQGHFVEIKKDTSHEDAHNLNFGKEAANIFDELYEKKFSNRKVKRITYPEEDNNAFDF